DLRIGMNRCGVAVLFPLVLSGACGDFTNHGVPCGNTRMVDARVTLPDTGLGAGGDAGIGFSESVPGLGLDESNLIVWTFPPANPMFADDPPRVRLVTDGGTVLLDLQSTSAYQGSWYVRQAIPHGDIRDVIVSAFQMGSVTLEFSSGGNQKVTRVRPNVSFAG